MKYLLIALLSIFSSLALATAPSAVMESSGGGISITFSDSEEAVGFEKYNCLIIINRSWAYRIGSTKQPDGKYKCQDQGALSSGTYYEVVIEFEDSNDKVTLSPMFLLKG